MKTLKLGKHTIEMYDAIEDLPIMRFHKYNKMLLIDSGIGSDLTDIDSHIEKAGAFIRTNEPDKAIDELNNLRKAIYFVQMSLSPKHLALAALITKVDGKECDDLSDDGLQKVLNLIADLNNKQAISELETAKKKIENELHTYFPTMFDSANEKEYYDLLKKRTVATLNNIISNSSDNQNVAELTDKLLTFTNPPIFDGTENVEVRCDKHFERMCLMLSQQLGIDARHYSVLAFYNAYEYLKETMKKPSKK